MNKELLAKAYEALNGDLGNTYLLRDDDKYLAFTGKRNSYTCLPYYDEDEYEKYTHQYICTVEEFNNYKEEDMNKTVRDAVIEFKGETSNIPVSGKQDEPLVLLRIRDENGKKGGLMCGGSVGFDEIYYSNICTYDEFNTYVDSLSHHAGKELFRQYLAADKPLLEKECKSMDIDYTSEEFWEDELYSPYLCVIINSKTGLKIWKRSLPAINSEFYRFDEDSEFYGGIESYSVSEHTLILRPQPKPVFTQAMANHGIKPLVGMECNFKKRGAMESGVVTAITKRFIIFTDSFGDEHVRKIDDLTIEPLTPPVSPEEQALNDMVEQLTNEGIVAYDPIMLRILIEKFKNNKISGVSFKPLTVDKS